VSEYLVGSAAFKAVGTGDPRWGLERWHAAVAIRAQRWPPAASSV